MQKNLDEEFLEFVVKSLVDSPEAVKVKRTVDEMGVLLVLDVAPEDMGKIIGRSGKTAQAIRSLLRVVGMKNHARVTLKVNEPVGGKRSMMGAEGGFSSHPSSNSSSNQKVSDTMRSVDEAMEDLKL